jgi:hypothetical protein
VQRLTETESRVVAAGLILFGVAHLVTPGALLAAARRAYDLGLDVEFSSGDGSTGRVRLVGVGMVLAGPLVGLVLPRERDGREEESDRTTAYRR